MRQILTAASIALLAALSQPAPAMPSQFDDLDGSTFCSIDKGHVAVLIDGKGNTKTRADQSVCLTLAKVEDVWKVRIEWWSKPMNRRHIEYAIAGWINPKTLAYIEATSSKSKKIVIGEGYIRYVNADTINFLQFGRMENGSALMVSEDLTRVDSVPAVNIPLNQ